MRKWWAAGAMVVLLACGGWAVLDLSRTIHQVNEPDPTKFDPSNIKRILKLAGIEAEISKVLYINQDSMGYIFEGKVLNVDKSEWTPFNDCWVRQPRGLVFVKQNTNSSTVGLSNYSTIANLDPFFAQHWKDLVK